MKKKGFKLQALKIKSFVTFPTEDARNIRAGESLDSFCELSCEFQCPTTFYYTDETCGTGGTGGGGTTETSENEEYCN
jgi:hypothetical protein